MVTIRQERGKGYYRWTILVDGFVLVEGLTKGGAAGIHRLLAPLNGIISQIVSRERSTVLRDLQQCLDGLADQTDQNRKAA